MLKKVSIAVAAVVGAAVAVKVVRTLLKPTSGFISQIWVHPVKSLGGMSVQSWKLVKTGLQYDREWIIMREGQKNALTQRECPKMKLLSAEINKDALCISSKQHGVIAVPLHEDTSSRPAVQVDQWGLKCTGVDEGDRVAEWLSKHFPYSVRLVRVRDHRIPSTSESSGKVAEPQDRVAFQDFSCMLLCSEEGIEWAQQNCDKSVNVRTFRPNIVTKGIPFPQEDAWKRVRLGSVMARNSKMCARCVLTTVTEEGAFRHNGEPLKTLRKLRSAVIPEYPEKEPKAMFGINIFHESEGTLSVGDPVVPLAVGPAPKYV